MYIRFAYALTCFFFFFFRADLKKQKGGTIKMLRFEHTKKTYEFLHQCWLSKFQSYKKKEKGSQICHLFNFILEFYKIIYT